MIAAFYSHTFDTLGAVFWRFRIWLHRHPWWARVLAVVVIDVYVVLFGNAMHAMAADSGIEGSMFGATITDSAGVPLSAYLSLPLDRGDVWTLGKFVIAMWLDPIWSGHLWAVATMIWFCNWLLSFEWVSIIALPFRGLANLLQDFLGEIAWIPFALTVAGGLAGIAILLGKHAKGWSEIVISASCAVLATGMLANPIVTLTAAGGALDKAQEFGGQIAAVVATDDIDAINLDSDNLLSASVTSQLVDIFVRIPAQTIAFGSALEGECAVAFTDTMMDSAPIMGGGNTVRDAVGACSEEARQYNQNPNFGQVIATIWMTPGSFTLFLIPMIFGIIFLITVVGFLIAAIKTMWNIYIGILPVNRYPLWKALADTAMGVVAIVFMAVVMTAVLKVTVAAISGLSQLGIPIFAQMGFATLVMFVLIFMVWRARRAAKRAGRSLAQQLSQYGLGKGGKREQNKVKALAVMGSVATVAAAAVRRPDRRFEDNSVHNNFIPGAPMQGGGGMTPPSSPSGPGSSGGPLSLPAGGGSGGSGGSGGGGSGGGGGVAQPSAKTESMVLTGVQVAKGATTGGVGGAIGALVGEVGKRGAQRAVTAATAAKEPSAEGTTKRAPLIYDAAPADRAPSSRITVDGNGVGHIAPRPSTPQVFDISSLPPREHVSPGSIELRERLAIAQK